LQYFSFCLSRAYASGLLIKGASQSISAAVFAYNSKAGMKSQSPEKYF